MLTRETMQDVQQQIEWLRLAIRHYSRCAIATHRRQRREWFETRVRQYEAMVEGLAMVMRMEGAR